MRTDPPRRADAARGQPVPERRRGGFFSHRGLMLAASVLAMADAVVALAAAPAARALAPQVTALAPLAVFHDLRWVYGYNGSWAGFGGLLAGLLAARTAVDAALVRLAWPRGVDPPRLPGLLRSAAVAAVFTGVVLSPLVTLAFGVALLPFSWPLLGTLPVLLLMAALLSHAGVVPWWWRALPPVRAAGWAVADFVVLSAAAAAAGSLPAAWAVPVAGVAGLFNARAWYGVTTALAVPQTARRCVPRPARRLPVAPLAVVLAVAMVIGVARLAFSAASAARPAGVTATAAEQVALGADQAAGPASTPGYDRRRPPVLEIQGFGSSCCSDPSRRSPLSAGGIVQQFSYRGLSANGTPLPDGPTASDLPLPLLGDRIAAQVWRLHRQTGQLVDLVAESEGTLGVEAMLARHPGVPLGSVVLLSPILDPGQASYPTAGTGGPGVVPGGELRAVVSFIGGLSPFGASGAQQLISSVNSTGARYAGTALTFARHHPVRWMEAVPLADALTLPACTLPPNAVVVAALHGGLAGDAGVQRMVREFFAGRAVRAGSGLQEAAGIVAAAATAWRMPESALPSPPCPAS